MDTTKVEWNDTGTKITFCIVVETPGGPWSAQVTAGFIDYDPQNIYVRYELSTRLKGIKCFPCPMKGRGKAALQPLIECLKLVPNPDEPAKIQTFLGRLLAMTEEKP